jgi:3-methyl-2-oxobutanoate hydroxymethyltransferase
VKLEGPRIATIKRIVEAGVPVMGHLGLTPQSQTALGGYRVQGKTADSATRLLADAHRLVEAGCFAIVLEAMPEPVAQCITESISVPTIGIGAGKFTSGQVLVQQDMLGIFDRFQPRYNLRIS